ncbi:MAG TPA: Rieske 2Fe-2S domain-containing protein [Candidatus Thermoplasmatota archaeon]|nr:Rieske 2Fe-2S domain-containing protein [Candidatus Thermoplasmatota archaeon]
MTDATPGPDDFRPTPVTLPGQKPKGESLLSRRDFIKRSVQLAVAGALVPGVLSQLLPAVAPDALGGGGAGPVIRRDAATNSKIPITVADLAGSPPVVITAEWNFLPAVVYKVHKTKLQASSEKRGYNTAQLAIQHPDEDDMAIMVYRGKCKHLGCTVGFNKGLGASADVSDYDGDGLPDGRILCPCHQGQYDIHDLCRNVPGTPPPAPLDVIRFNVGDYAGDPERAIPAAAGAIIGVELLPQAKYRDADLDKQTAFNLGSMAPALGGA